MSSEKVDIAEQIGLLWNYTTNKGLPFLADSSQVPILRSLLNGEKLEDIEGFGFIKEYNEEWADELKGN